MPIGIVSDEDFEALLNKKGPIPTEPAARIEVDKAKGRAIGDQNIPDSIRKAIGITAVESGRSEAVELAEFFDVSKSSASAYAVGASSTTTYNNPKSSLTTAIGATKNRITERASRKINKAFNHLTDDKLKEASGPELASMIKSFAGVIKDMEAPTESPNKGINNQVQFVIHTPPIVREEKFNTIVVNDARDD